MSLTAINKLVMASFEEGRSQAIDLTAWSRIR